MGVDRNQGLMPSLLDRLIDPDSEGTVARRGYSIEQMYRTVQRDLEDLLNTRHTAYGVPEEYVELHRSVYGYGLPDLVSLNQLTDSERGRIASVIEQVIDRFEPRLKNVRVTIISDETGKQTTVRFHIQARLALDPAPEVAFDTVLELTTGHYDVRASNR